MSINTRPAIRPTHGTTHTVIESAYTSSSMHKQRAQLSARAVKREGSEGESAQIEVHLECTPSGGKRTTSLHHSVCMSADEARRFALALCPELTLRSA